MESVLKALKSWLSHDRRPVDFKIKIKGDAPSLVHERVPSKAELRRIFLSGDKRVRVAMALIAHSGLRIHTLGNYSGTEGLRVGDFPELVVTDAPLSSSKSRPW